jgi:hypothetical protein
VPLCPPQIPHGLISGSNPGLRGGRPATNRLSHGTANIFNTIATSFGLTSSDITQSARHCNSENHFSINYVQILYFNRHKKSNPITGLDKPLGFQEFEAPRFLDSRHINVIRLSDLGTGHLYPQKIFLVLISVRGGHDPRDIVRPKRLCQ